jgi:hypothetical protein
LIKIILQELDNPWTGESPLQEIISLIDQNSFVNFQEMEFDVTLNWVPYDIKKAIQTLKRRKKVSTEFRTQEPFPFSFTLSKNPLQNTITLDIHENFLKEVGIEPVTKIIIQLAKCFPRFHWGVASVDDDISEFYDSQDLPHVPECFKYFVSWLHIVSPLGYEKYFNREDFLGVPAYEVLEWDNGIIQIMTFENPLAFGIAENRQRVIDVTHYLNERRKDWKQ